jgi:hypothetical protein
VKICSKCKICKEDNRFCKRKSGLDSHCKDCKREYDNIYYSKNSEKIRNRRKKWYSENSTRADKTSKKYWLKYKYGISLEERTRLFIQQNGKCAVCSRHESEFKKELSVDHSHKTGKVRGLLCAPCNHALGLLKEDVKRMSNLIKYVERNCEFN